MNDPIMKVFCDGIKMLCAPPPTTNTEEKQPKHLLPECEPAIFCDGVPQMTVTSEEDLASLLRGIQVPTSSNISDVDEDDEDDDSDSSPRTSSPPMCVNAIYNQGKPALTVTTESDLAAIYRGIQCDALDECFPLDAQDAAELEAVDEFNATMAALDMMEENEENSRTNFSHLKKRWEVRRAMGLVGHPHPPRHLVEPVQHPTGKPINKNITSIIPYSHAHKIQIRDGVMRRKDVFPRPVRAPKTRNPIQQPRKQTN